MTKKITKKGELILKTLQNMKGFCTAQDLHKKISSIDLSTIYRNLEKFSDMKLVQKISLPNQEFVYEFSTNKHHHTVCDSCSNIKHITLPSKVFKGIPELEHFDPESIEVIIHGSCKQKHT